MVITDCSSAVHPPTPGVCVCILLSKLTPTHHSPRIKDHYKLGSHGSLSKSSVYQHFLQTWQNEVPLSATSFGKLVKKAFPDIRYNKKGPRGQSVQHYTHLKRIDHDKKLRQIIALSSVPAFCYPISPLSLSSDSPNTSLPTSPALSTPVCCVLPSSTVTGEHTIGNPFENNIIM